MNPLQSDLLGDSFLFSSGGSPLQLLDADAPASGNGPGVKVAVDRRGTLPLLALDELDAMITVRADAPAPWVSVAPERIDAQLATISKLCAQNPIAAAMLARVLRIQSGLDFAAAVEVESLAYSALLGGNEFAEWLARRRCSGRNSPTKDLVDYARQGDAVTLTLASPGTSNAMSAAMRDALFEALANVVEDPSCPTLTLCGEGRCFSTGGDLAEFGSAKDHARAHLIRTQRSAAVLMHRLGPRASVRLHGACIGSGIEIAAAASKRVGASNTMVQLPELAMGLIPGAGGTVSLARAIGRHRLMWMCLGAFRIGAERALDWGLLHDLEP